MQMDIANPHFAEPAWLWLAVGGPLLLLALQRYAAVQRHKQLASLASPRFIAHLVRSLSPARRRFKNVLLLVAVGTMGLALARPQWGETAMTSQAAAEDVLVLLDCSRSMLATDVRPNRLERAKLAILDFLKGHANSRIGLIVFAGQAFLQCPLTFDHAAFRETLATVDEKSIPVSGTDLGRALDEAFLASENPRGRQLMLMFTDGEDLQDTGIQMAERLAENKVMVMAVGVGTPTGSEIPIVTEKGLPDVVRDDLGRPVRTRLQEETLIKIAQATHGSYRPLGPLGEGLGAIKTDLETRRVEEAGRAKTQGVDRFHLPLALATILLVTESVVGTRRGGQQPSSGRKDERH